jgi:hypothetical protein
MSYQCNERDADSGGGGPEGEQQGAENNIKKDDNSIEK